MMVTLTPAWAVKIAVVSPVIPAPMIAKSVCSGSSVLGAEIEFSKENNFFIHFIHLSLHY